MILINWNSREKGGNRLIQNIKKKFNYLYKVYKREIIKYYFELVIPSKKTKLKFEEILDFFVN